MASKPLESHMPEGENAPANYVPAGFDTVEAYLADARENYKLDLEADKENRDAARDDLKFASGDHWDPKVKRMRRNKPCLTIHDIPQFLNQVAGDRRTNPSSVKVLPIEDGDTDIATIRSDLIRNIELQSRAERVYNATFKDMLACGISNFQICTKYAADDVFDQDIVIERIANPLAVIWDRLSVDHTGRDADRCYVDDNLPRKLAEKRWKDVQWSGLASELEAELRQEGWCTKDTVRVTAHWRMITKTRRLILFVDGSVKDVTDIPPEEIDPATIKRERTVERRYAQRHLITGHAILEGPYELPIPRLPVIKVSGQEVQIDDKRVRFGLVRWMKDPARLRDFWRSEGAGALGYATKIKYMATASAVEGRENDFRLAHLSDDPLLITNDNHPMPQRLDPPQVQSALINEAAMNTKDMQDVTGIREAGLGMRSNETSGRAILARQREGDIANIVYHDNMNDSILEGGDVINHLIPVIIDGTRTIRLLGEDGETRMQRVNDDQDPDSVDLSKGLYDVTLSTGASFATRRLEATDAMQSIIQADPSIMVKAGDIVFKNMDVAGAEALAERMKKFIPPEVMDDEEEDGPALPPQVQAMIAQTGEQMQAMQEALLAAQAQIEQLQDGRALELRKLDIDAYNAETNRLKAVTTKDFPLGPDAVAMLAPVVAQAVREALASPDVLPPAVGMQ